MCSFLVYILILCTFSACEASEEIHYLDQGGEYSYRASTRSPEFHVFCYRGRPKYLIHVWQSVFLQLDHPNDDYKLYNEASPEKVMEVYKEKQYSWSFNIFVTKQKQMRLDPFNTSCIGVESKHSYRVTLNVIRIDYWKVLFLIGGISLFLSANKLSKNSLFYYLCGIALGICTSFLILIYFISKLFPKKPVMYGVAACGWTVGIYLFQLLWDNIRVILVNYKLYLLYYALLTGLISFIVCYRWGPVENERTRNLIRWALQGVSLVAIFFSSQFQEAAMGQIVAVLLFHNIPQSWMLQSRKYWKKMFPPRIKPLTNDEYYEQGVKETSKALRELKEYCSSPECNQWQLALKLRDVKRFASFIEGNSHLSDEEILEYETSIHTTDLTDDDSDEFTDEEQ